ncbi:MAG: Sulfate-binding protein precursor [Lentisphaerae bacterium ADurb.Bin242]|nr:MAG: Sulfate-binding protein precursor [Lentisphaerae bacterium ADurb.Bin242]
MNRIFKWALRGTAVRLLFGLSSAAFAAETVELLNVSYDPTRELYRAYNAEFQKYWKEKTGQHVVIKQSHGGSGKQARAVIDGISADVVTLALAYDIDAIALTGKRLIARDWQKRLPENSSPYTSTIVFLVRKGNPKNIRSWEDLVRPGVEVITPNPKTSGGARWNYLAGYGYTLQRELGDIKKVRDPRYAGEVKKADEVARKYLADLFQHVIVLDSGARGSTTTFIQRKLGDVLLAWENEAILSIQELGKDAFDVVVPPVSILTEPPVTIVDRNVEKKGTGKVAEEYLKHLYSPAAQKIIASYGYRPVYPQHADKGDLEKFPKLTLIKLTDLEPDWISAQKRHFSDGGVFDQIYQGRK